MLKVKNAPEKGLHGNQPVYSYVFNKNNRVITLIARKGTLVQYDRFVRKDVPYEKDGIDDVVFDFDTMTCLYPVKVR